MSEPGFEDHMHEPVHHAIEQRGIEYIPAQERRGTTFELFWMWVGGLLNVQTVAFGALVPVIGLSFGQAVLAIVIANLGWFICGLSSLPGPSAGTTALTVTRAPFGPLGARVPALLNWLSNVAFEITGMFLMILAGVALAGKAGIGESDGLKIGLIVIAAFLSFILPIFGHSIIMRTLKGLVPLFGVLFVILLIIAVPKIHTANLEGGGNFALWLLGLSIAFSVSGLSWMGNAADYARYLPSDTSPRKTVLAVGLGGFLPMTLLMTLGAGVVTISESASDPVSGLPAIFPGWFVVPYLIVAVVQLLCINALDLYSSGVTLQALGLKVKRPQAIAIDTALCSAVTAIAVFSSSFYTFLTNMLLFVMVWMAPWGAILIVDWLLRRGRYDSPSLFSGRKGIYWRGNGVHVAAAVAQIAGMAVSLLWLDTTVFEGPISKATDGADLSIISGFCVAAVAYFFLARRGVRAEAGVARPEPPEALEPEMVAPTP